MQPKVSFIIPCYNLAHFLSDCVNSILSQTYRDFEVLIMDDCSPDHTPEIAQSFHDPRVIHVRNEKNLGHLHNFNKGIELSRGKYLWLISPDDGLRKPYALDRYVTLLDAHPEIGYVFCPSVRLEDGQEHEVMTFTAPFDHDKIINGDDFLREKLLEANCVAAPASLTRKECYEKVSLFPLDLPYSGDWYLWCAFALHWDVGYFVEPMVYRRYHQSNMSKTFWKTSTQAFFSNNVAVPWRIKERAAAADRRTVARRCKDTIVAEYVWQLDQEKKGQVEAWITFAEFEESLHQHAQHVQEEREIQGRVLAGLGELFYWRADFHRASHYLGRALRVQPWILTWWIKYALVPTGRVGMCLRESLATYRRLVKRALQ